MRHYTSFTLTKTLAISKSGSGTVASLPGGINCGSTCSAPFVADSAVTLTAAPASGFAFAYWMGACSGASATCNLIMTTDTNVTAVFDPIKTKEYRLTTAKRRVNAGDGTITSDDGMINCGRTCSKSYYPGTPVALSATAADKSTFTGWSGPCTGTDTCVVTIDKAKTVHATFVGPYNLKVVKASKKKGTGTVTSSLPGINCGSDCQEKYPLGTAVTLTATPDLGSTFTGWTPKSICAFAGDCTVTMYEARTVRATFTGTGATGPGEEGTDSMDK